MELKSKIRIIEDFPEKGISFKDITTLLKDGKAFKDVIDRIVEDLKGKEIDYIAGPEARGFVIGSAVAYALGVGFIPIRKPGKLPAEVVSHKYELEYGSNTLELHLDAIENGKKVVVVDDLLATGGTILSVINLIESIGGEVVALEFLIELESLKGRKKLQDYHINSLVKYNI
ncbi:adenine phosphoribosyltransferase [Tissierella praeacuta DSM 18095]|uniref:Adenine phosphoribosyltransferase n=1 Tax=Tissierella praeacuta DSM 18095 TaxID=1123404 RepID=A0A1M4S687_9FIRM|nr:adenine phosphoribosyltransferase [Tissierella praeacuta]TCU71639.1 adenine phosphoribosyltransferase [Tissierella praeacuta]SHE27690.1 adenine phosphoribosyltransferase [Tissierella praeacuta DSM 18095]SUP00958.1 Adenine phosphoribosyltransferase [Tissierella praeacuta]